MNQPNLENKIIGFTCGAFDVIHPGHMLLLKEASEKCDYLVVALQTDPSIDRPDKNSPVQNIEERYIMLHSLKYIDSIMLYETEAELEILLKSLRPDIWFIGSDHKGKKVT